MFTLQTGFRAFQHEGAVASRPRPHAEEFQHAQICSIPSRRCVCAAVSRGSRAGVDGSPDWNRQGRTGRRPCGCRCACQLAGADWRAGDSDHERERATALPGAASGSAYVLDIAFQGFTTYHEEDIPIGAGATIERTAVLTLAGLAESVAVEEAGSRIEARDSGFVTRFGPEDLNAIPTRRVSMFDFIRAAPGVSPTSPGSATITDRVGVRLRHQ